MKKQTLLIVAASLMLPLTQCTDKNATASNTDATASMVQQRTAAYATLAAIPADVEAVISINHVGQIIQGLAANGIIPAEQVTEDMTMWDGGAVAFSSKAMGTLEKLLPVLKQVKVNAAPGAQPQLSEQDVQAIAQAIDTCGPIGPVYATIAVNPGAEPKLAEMYNKCMADLVQKKDVYAEYNGYKGIHKNLVDEKHLAQLPAPIAEALKKHSFYAVSKLVGNTIQIVVCEDVADIRHAASPEESVLATDKLKAGDAHLGGSSYVIAYGSQKLADLSNQMNSIGEQLDSLTPMLDSLGDAPEAAQVKEGMGKVLAELKKLDNTAPVQHADFMQIWSDGTIHMEARGDARGYTFQPAKLVGAQHAANAAVYVEWTPGTCGSDFSMAKLWEGVEQTLPAIAKAAGAEGEAYLAEYNQAKPVIQGVGNALGTVGSGMGGSSFVLVDGNGSMPSDKPEGMAVPRVVYASGVTNRPAFAQGWAQLKDAVAQGLTAYGQDPAIVNMLPAQEVQEGNATVTSLVTPLNGPDFAANVAISDQVIAFGTSPKQTAVVANSDTASAETFAGVKFSVNMDALSKLNAEIAELTATPEVQQHTQKAAQYIQSVSGSITVEGGECIIKIDTVFK